MPENRQGGGAAAPRDVPILFSAPMIRALLAGRKTQTRRLAWLTPRVGIQIGDGPIEPILTPSSWQKLRPGDRLWVRESWRPVHSGDPSQGARYRADYDADQTVWRVSIHMPRWASRLTLVVTEVRLQRLQDITEDDAIAEGMLRKMGGYRPGTRGDHIGTFAHLWDQLHGKDAWDRNPEVVAISFAVHPVNIDRMEAVTA